jgi:RHS repeat-associated protein
VTIGYDGAGRRTSLSNAEATATLHYDDAGRLDTVTQSIDGGPQDLETSYIYDNFDRLETMTYPSGQVLTYGWDNRNWLTSLTGEDGSGVEYLHELTYHSSGAPDVVTFANNVVTDYGIDVRNRVDAIVTNGPGPTTLADVGLLYDSASNITDWDNAAAPARTRHFDYDELNRLTSATSTGLWGNLSFTYDALGNRLTQTWDSDITTYVYDFATNRLTGLMGAQLGAVTYDAVGRIKTEARNSAGDQIFSDGFESGTIDVWGSGIGPAGTLIYTFNNADQLEQIEEAGQLLGVYAYDGDGLRVKATTNGETVYYFRDQSGNTIAEYDTSGDLNANYLYAGGRQVAKATPDGASGYDISYFHPDHLGSAMVITNDNGVVTWSGDYRPFGEPVSSAGTADRYRFTGHELDIATNLTYAKARYYNARLGRFLSVDPVGGSMYSPQSLNRYIYVEDNPLTATDPTGQIVETIWDAGNVAFGVASLGNNLWHGNWGSAALDAGGVALDVAATLVPFVPGGAGTAIKVGLAANTVDNVVDAARGADHLIDAARAAEEGGEVLSRLGRSRESVGRLGRKAAEAEESIGIHGVSTTAGPPRGAASRASRGSVESQFKVHNTPTRSDPLHRTVELPKPVTQTVADAFNRVFGRSK